MSDGAAEQADNAETCLAKLMGKLEFGTDAQEVERIARQIGIIRDRGVEVAIVVGRATSIAGLTVPPRGMDRATGDYMGMLATLLNALTLQDVLESTATSPGGFGDRRQEVAGALHSPSAMRHLEKGRIVIFAAGTGNPFFTTDTAAALRALEIHAETILMAKTGWKGFRQRPGDQSDAAFIPGSRTARPSSAASR